MSVSKEVEIVVTGESRLLDEMLQRHDGAAADADAERAVFPVAWIDAAVDRCKAADLSVDEKLRSAAHIGLRRLGARLERRTDHVRVSWFSGYADGRAERDALAAAYPLLDFDVAITIDAYTARLARYRRGLFCGNYILFEQAFDADEHVVDMTLSASSAASLKIFIEALGQAIALERTAGPANEPCFRVSSANLEATRSYAECYPSVHVTLMSVLAERQHRPAVAGNDAGGDADRGMCEELHEVPF
jgi:hypothetical protein